LDGVEPDPNVWHDDCPIQEREQRMINVGEVTLNVACRGAGPTVVFLHGFPEFHYGWNKVMDELANDFRLVAPDQRGYNLSDKPEELDAYALPRLTQDILTLLPLVSKEPVILVAHDWGGPVGWLVAHNPDAFIRAFISTNGPHPIRFAEYYAEDEGQQQASSYMNAFKQPWAEALFTEDALLDQFGFADVLSEEEIEIYKEAWFQPGAITGGLNWYRANDLTTMTRESLMDGLLEKVQVPTSVLWGLADTALLEGNIEGLDAFVVDLEITTFEGVDHWIAHRIPEEVADGIRAIHLRALDQ